MTTKLSNSITKLKDRYGIIVIGSGYGGSITAARLAAAGHEVCLFERGKEWMPGEFPDEMDEMTAQFRSDTNPLGLYDFRATEDIDIFVGCGLGGTSLINANVIFKPEEDVFDNPRWPDEIRNDRDNGKLNEYYEKVNGMLQGSVYPDGNPSLRKITVHEKSARGRPGTHYKLNLAVNFEKYENEPNHVGVHQRPCILCGDCMTGCNVLAKNTLYMNYLPFAKSRGASIITEMEVNYISKADGGGYFVHSTSHSENKKARIFHANVVVVAAGTLGSTHILLNSRDRGLAVSDKLGHYFSGNADSFGIGYNNDHRTDVLGFGNIRDKRSKIHVGPLIVSVIDYRGKERGLKDRYVIEEGCFPRAFIDFTRYAMPKISALAGHDTDFSLIDEASEAARVMRDIAHYDVKGALNHSMLYLGIGHDSADGVIVVDAQGKIRIHWGAAPSEPIFQKIDDEMKQLTKALGGTYIKNPRWTKFFGRNIITVHPLGGCAMGKDAGAGVVDHRGRVFDPAQDALGAVHDGLFVADGSIIPTSLGVNPFFSISALSERIADLIIHDTAINKNPKEGLLPAPVILPPLIGIEFSSEMNGYFSENVKNAKTPEDYKAAEKRGQQEGNDIGFVLTMYIDSVDKFVIESAHEARVEGHIEMGGMKQMVEQGRFNLFIKGPQMRTKHMFFSLPFFGCDGHSYLLNGYKEIRDDPDFDIWEIWKDYTTLFVTLYKGNTPQDPVVGQGILRMRLQEVTRQLATFLVRNAPHIKIALSTKNKFMSFFFGELYETYVKQLMSG
ncbi:MAG: GMC family oxidoreductase [Candidatus Brocadiaceae bacterium]|nr:GMC family oxidoreductase [Candidatus Brocadiaceae bacterium]